VLHPAYPCQRAVSSQKRSRRYRVDVKTVVIGPPPPELQRLVQQRRSLGLDRFDEVWEGSQHLAPVPGFGHAYIEREVARVLRPFADAAGLIETGPFNLGRATDYRVPDGGYHRSVPERDAVYVTTAVVVVEVLASDDETHEKLPFYAGHGVEEVIVVEPASRTVRILTFGGGYQEVAISGALGISAEGLQSAVRWPSSEGPAV
jgi:Putative restriction endonuclease